MNPDIPDTRLALKEYLKVLKAYVSADQGAFNYETKREFLLVLVRHEAISFV